MKPIPNFSTVTIGMMLCQALVVQAGDYGEKYENYPVDAGYQHASPEALEAWRDRKYGMRIVWGVYSMLGVQASWPLTGSSGQFREKYQELYKNFNPADFNGDRWAELMKRCGFNYFTFITKHHDGFAMWDTQTKVRKRFIPSGPKAGQIEDCDLHYDIMETPFGRDILRELVDATRKRGISTGLYFSHADWYDADFRLDKWNPHRDASYSKQTDPEGWKRFVARHREQVRELLTNYGKVDQFEWDLCFPESAWPDVVETVKMARSLQPDVLMRDRGIGMYGDIMTPEMWIPQANPDEEPAKGQGQTVDKPWQVIYNMAGIASYDPKAENYKSAEWILSSLIDTVAKGGNFMPMLGPDAKGNFHPVAVERLERVGRWLAVNGEAIYKTRPFRAWNEGDNIRFTRSKDDKSVYAISLKWPGRELKLRKVRAREGSQIRMLGYDEPLAWRQDQEGLSIELPARLQDERNRPCELAYAFKIEQDGSNGVKRQSSLKAGEVLPDLQAQPTVRNDKPGMLFYEPAPGNAAADNWCFKRGDLWYVYTLNGNGSIGVGVSSDLMLYEPRGDAITGSLPWENGLFGGDVFAWKGKYRMLYSAPGPGYVNAIGLAESEDLLRWKKHPGNPVMHHPDARWYEGATQDGMRGGISCRDVSVIEDALTDEWVYACFTASTGRGDYYRRGCIGLARSKNLIEWEYLPPLFSPGVYTAMEVPRVCRIGSKWFLTWLHAPWYGLRTDEDYGQRAYTGGETMIHYAVADKPLGPYRMADDPTLFRGNASPYVIDLVQEAGEVLVTTTMFKQQGAKFDDRERCGLMPAMPIRQAKDAPDKLEVGFPEKLRKYFADPLAVIEPLRVNNPLPELQDVVKQGNRITFTKTSNRLVELTEPTKADFLIEVDFQEASGRVGLATRYDREARKGCVVLVDPKRKELQFAELDPIYSKGIILRVLERHNITSPVGSDFRLSVIQSRDYQLVFINDVLAATFSFARRNAGVVGLFLENATGKCAVKGIRARQP